uniref:Uncharacterized protein n=2 Tax=Oryza sativa subsp. japonica TaxID=39947 RepID=Q8H4J7_ORYSJ|nr:hypothetical protein [Oryza sativa Japonica Group]BAC82937.1 hypothetical protein [Oryza sativa Japonica Group]
MDEDDYSSLSPWMILSTTKSVKYIDTAHYAVPGGARVVELVTGMETAMVQEVSTVPGLSYRLEFSVGDAGDGRSGSLTVQAYACGDERGGRRGGGRRRAALLACCYAVRRGGRLSAEEKADVGATATAVRSIDGRTAIAAASGGVAAMGNPTAAPSATPSSRGLLLGRPARPTRSSWPRRRWPWRLRQALRVVPSSRWLAREGEAGHTVDVVAAEEEDAGHRSVAGSGRGGGGDEEDTDNHYGNADDHHAHQPPRARTPPPPPAAQPCSPPPVLATPLPQREVKKKRKKERGKREMTWHADTWVPR